VQPFAKSAFFVPTDILNRQIGLVFRRSRSLKATWARMASEISSQKALSDINITPGCIVILL
jgi:hypothetical protein